MRPTDPNPYATHLPVLMGLGHALQIRSVLELGSGPFSTVRFLDRSTFPWLERLVSLEDDAEWNAVVQEAIGADERLETRMVEAVRESVPLDLAAFDLIFIDDSRLPAERSRTIAEVARLRPKGLVVIHDFEQRPYSRAARAFDHRFVFRSFTPQVGVCWNGEAVDRRALQGLADVIESSRTISPLDVSNWDTVWRTRPVSR